MILQNHAIRSLLACIVVLGTLPSCALLKSLPEAEAAAVGGSAERPVNGNFYYLPKGMVTITGAPVKDQTGLVVTTSLGLESDPSARYLLEHQANVLFEDEVTIGVGSNGLLTNVNSVTTDKTPQILNDLASTFVSAARLSASMAARSGDNTKPTEPKPFKVVFDPLDRGSVYAAESALKSAGFKLDVMVPDIKSGGDTQSSGSKVGSPDGVLFRVGRPVVVVVNQLNAPEMKHRAAAMVPDPNLVFAFDSSRAALVKKTTDLTFSNGMLTSSKVTRPSLVAAVIGIPKSILTTVLPLPQFLREDETNAIKAQNELDALRNPPELQRLTDEIALLKARQELDALRTPPSQ